MANLISKFFGWVLTPILNAINFPVVPAELVAVIDKLFELLGNAMSVFNFFCPLSAVAPALAIFLVIYAAYHAYLITLWVLKKIPVLGIE